MNAQHGKGKAMAKVGRPKKRPDDLELKNINFRASKEFVKRLKVYCVEHDTSMQDFIVSAIQDKMKAKK